MFDDLPGADAVFDFDEIANHLLEQGEQCSPAELHGCLTGLIAGGATSDPAAGLAGLNQSLDIDLHGELAERMLDLYTVTLAALQDEEFDFHPLLPDDTEELDQRIAALAAWSRGFLLGYARVTTTSGRGDQSLPGFSAEILKDMAAISQAGIDEDLSEDESEGHYIEVLEYLRFAALNVFVDTQNRDVTADDRPPSVH